MKRRSIRKYLEKPISDKDLNMILEAGRWAPSGTNFQPWEFIVIKNREILKQIYLKTKSFALPLRTAQIGVGIVGKISKYPRVYFDGEAIELHRIKELCLTDCSLAAMNMMLMAWSLKIGSCCIGSLDREYTSKILHINNQDFLPYILALGYIKGELPKPARRKDLNEICRFIE
ncbi:MAG: nitroreductase family protein [Promethearchaeota archaeon]